MTMGQGIKTLIVNHKNAIMAFVLAALLNIGIMALLPGLIQTAPRRPDLNPLENSIHVVRIKRPDIVRKKEPPPPPKPEKQEIRKSDESLARKPVSPKIRLPFKFNPKLMTGSQTLSVPSMDLLSLEAPGLQDTYSASDLDAPLTATVKVPPIYPMRAKRMGIEGAVNVRFLVNKDGVVENVEILSAEPEDVFDSSVTNCVNRWRFKPGTVEGVPVKTWVETTIRFELHKS